MACNIITQFKTKLGRADDPSVVTSKLAIEGHFKTGHR
jgi:hypothetical protein